MRSRQAADSCWFCSNAAGPEYGQQPGTEEVVRATENDPGIISPAAVDGYYSNGPMGDGQSPGVIKEGAGEVQSPVALRLFSAKTIEIMVQSGNGAGENGGPRFNLAAMRCDYRKRRWGQAHLDNEIPSFLFPGSKFRKA